MHFAKRCIWAVTVLIVLSFSVQVMANVSIVREQPDTDFILPDDGSQEAGLELAEYSGTIRISIVEPVARWKDRNGGTYENAHIWWALEKSLTIPDASVWDTTITWTGIGQFSNVSVNNIASVGFLSTSTPVYCDAYPPYGYVFAAYYTDASATAKPGLPGQDATSIAGFTHSVLVEEATATW